MEPKKGRDEKTRRFASFIRLFITLLALSVFSAGAGIAEGADVKFLVTSGAGIRAFAFVELDCKVDVLVVLGLA